MSAGPYFQFNHPPNSLNIQHIAINAPGAGVNTVVSGIVGAQIVVLKYKRIASAACSVTWESSGGQVLDGPVSLAANGGEVENYFLGGHFATVAGEDLVLHVTGAAQVGGNVCYIVL